MKNKIKDVITEIIAIILGFPWLVLEIHLIIKKLKIDK